MLDKVKNALRLKTSSFDVEVEGLIAACIADMRLSGINFLDNQPDPLIERAIILYCKGNFGYIEGNERFREAYSFQKHSLSLAGDYVDVEQ